MLRQRPRSLPGRLTAMFHRENWFAWFPVTVRARGGKRIAWLETVVRERFETNSSASAWRYYTTHH